MKLTRLELSGFKSFADTARLPFEDGVTAIVGPNGCGKSNISDAVRWVLGEQRISLLRGSRMEEVIFQGSAKRRPVNIAEARMYLDNSDNTLPIEYDEVEITRRLSRSGQSDYLVNGKSVRLKDLHDLLRGTGLASDVGVVIEAQMIDRLLSDRPDERRSLFEEAAGIGLYRDRKISTERRLEKTQEDLLRLDDLINEVQTQVRSLARQRGKAERHEKFVEERFGIVMTLARRELIEFDEQDAGLRERRASLATLVPAARRALGDLERARETQVQARATAEARRTDLERRLAENRVEMERLEGDLNLANERLGNASARKARALEERGQAEQRASQADRERDAAQAERVAAESARESVQMELGLRSATEEDVRDRLATQRNLVRETESQSLRLTETLRALAGERSAIESELTDLRVQSSEAESWSENAASELETAQKQLDSARVELERRKQQERAAGSELERARHDLAAAREREAAVRVERRAVEEKIAQLGARREALNELERAREGLAPATRALLLARERFGEGAVLGPLSDFVTASQSDARVTERLLAEWLHAVLVRDEKVVADVAAWHAETQPGPLVLLPVTAEPEPNGEVPYTPELTINAPAEPWVRALLSGAAALSLPGDAVRRPNGAIYLSNADASGPLSRRAELIALGKELEATEVKLEELNRATSRAADEHAAAERGLETATAAAANARNSLREAQAASEHAGRHIRRAEHEKHEADESLLRLNRRLADRSNRLKQLEVEQATGETERERLVNELETQRTTLAELETAQEDARERLVHWQVEEAQVSAREAAARERESRATEALDSARTEIVALDREMQKIEQDSEALTSQCAAWRDRLAELKVTIQEVEAAAQQAEQSERAAEAAVSQADEQIAHARLELDQLNEEAHRVDIAVTESAGRKQAMVERLEAEWHKPLNELLESAPDIAGETEELRQEAERLARTIEAMGPVNPLAVHEHAEETKRLAFLQEQRDDLVDARKGLLQALREIDETARTMFVETFEQIRQNFDTVFQTLFEGGVCDVRLVEEEDPLASPIDIFAAPRGKRTQRIHLLSSGERALVALSLLFAIYLTKPAPFCLLDEVDAPLDDANVLRFVRLLDEFKSETQFIVITHNPRTMQVADAVYGVTMQEPGASTIVGVRLGEAQKVAS